MTATITPVRVAVCPETPDGIGYEVKRVMPNWASAQRGKADLDAINPAAFQAYTPGLCAGEPMDAPEAFPPNCDGLYPDGYAYAGEVLAQAQHEAATDGDECDGAACLITRGSD